MFNMICKCGKVFNPLRVCCNCEIVGCCSLYADPLHSGHLNYLISAKKQCDRLIVIVNNNDQCIKKKGFYFLDESERYLIIKNLKMVDEVYISIDRDKSVNLSLGKFEKIDIFFNGGDVTTCREQETCDRLNIRTVFGVGGTNKINSSSNILKRFRNLVE